MQIHNLKRKNKNKRSVAVGRGGTRGKTSGRGTKGQNARAGRKKRPEMRDVIKRLPKNRGYFFKSLNSKAFPVNLSRIEALFSAGDTVSPKTLEQKGIIKSFSGELPKVKILATGEITKKVIISSCDVSASAKTKIESVGGSVK
jgi:large subunit ribosomal protein L15